MRKTKNTILIALLFLGAVVSSCFEDTSTLDFAPINGVEIDTTGMTDFSVYQFENLVVEPNLDLGDLSESDVSYEWKINLKPGDTTYQVIGEERNLSYQVNFKPNTSGQTHQLYYTVTDHITGLEYIMTWPVTVKNNIGEGLVIAETSDGVNSDISHIMSPLVTPDYTGVSVKHDIYSALNGTTLPGIIKQMRFASVYGVDALLAITENSVLKIKTLDYSFGGMNDDLFFGNHGQYQPQALGAIVQGNMYVGSGKLTGTYLGAAREFGLPFDFPYTVPDHVAFNAFNYYPLPVRISFYDEVNEHFVYLPTISSFGDNDMHVTAPSADGPFDPSNLPNKVNLAASVSSEGDFRHLLKDTETGNISLYVLDGGTDGYPSPGSPAPKAVYNLSGAPEIEDAQFFAFLDNQRVLYYATSTKIYAVLYSSTTPVFEERFAVPGGEEITTLQVYQQADYPQRSEGWDPPYIETNNKQLIMSTYSGSEGKVYILPFVNTGVGNIDTGNITTFEGFDRITVITTQL